VSAGMASKVHTAACLLGACLILIICADRPVPAAPSNATVPLCTGLTIVTAINQADGDYESIKTIESATDKAISLKYSNERRIQDAPTREPRLQKLTMFRTIPAGDLRTSKSYLQIFYERAPATVPGTTAIGTSSAVVRALKTKGETELGIFDTLGGELSADPKKHPSVYDYQMVEKIQRVGTGPVMVPLTLNGAKVDLPAIQARGDYFGKAEFFFLDDESNPLTLRFRLGIGAGKSTTGGDHDRLDVVKISYRCSGSGSLRSGNVTRLEQALLQTRRAEVYDIYFSFNSDQIREESEPTLDEIAELLRRHPDWKLGIEGHTDNIAGDSYNLDLSRRRAASVKTALVKTYSIDGNRLTTAGFGKSRPQDTNDTLEGRARNRRVELVRQS
jgi:outer membrane protein OmpA-like peptidoglycan-associated protein